MIPRLIGISHRINLPMIVTLSQVIINQAILKMINNRLPTSKIKIQNRATMNRAKKLIKGLT